MKLTPPPARETFDLAMADGAMIRVRRHGNPAGARLIISHGNGFAVDAYYPFWSLLLNDLDVVLFDLRNHGHNPRHTAAAHDIPTFVSDFETLAGEIRSRFGARPTACVFHSISAITAIRQILEKGWRWDALIAVDPPLIPSPGHALHRHAHDFELKLARWAANRPERFAQPAELAAKLAGGSARRRWVAGAHQLMAESVLRYDAQSRDWMLACPGEFESRIYASNAALDLWPRLPELDGNILFIGADAECEDAWPPALINQHIHNEFGHRYVHMRDTSHMIHVEKPAELAREVITFMNECGIA